MDTYELKKTPIKGLFELGRLDPSSNPELPDNRVVQLMKFLDLPINDSYHFRNPSVNKRGTRTGLDWHVDGFYSEADKTVPGAYSSDTVIFIDGEIGTFYRKSNRSIYRSDPNTIYAMAYDVVHSSPPNEILEDLDTRYMTRFYVERKSLIPRLKVKR